MKIVINTCYGGFAVSKEVYNRMGKAWDGYGFTFGDNRTDPELISVIEAIGTMRASGEFSELKIVEIPDNATDCEIIEHDGMEEVIYVMNGIIYHCD